MALHQEILIAGFGGQGILFTGHLLADAAMLTGLEVTWLPSYGPEMRGGTCNCSVIVSDTPIGAPMVLKPSILMVMNLPSFDKFELAALPGSLVLVDSTLVKRPPSRSDVNTVAVPATDLAVENGIDKLANVIMLGKMIKESSVFSFEAMAQCIGAIKRKDMVEPNIKALTLGYEY